MVVRVAAILFVIITGHTVLETTRDSLFLTELPPKHLALVYGALAALSVLAAPAASALCARYGEKRALLLTLLVAALGTLAFFGLPTTREMAFTLYLWTGVLTSVAVAQFWILTGRVFTIAQAKRLLGPIAAAGILGGVAGGGSAILLLQQVDVKQLLPVAALLFVGALLPLKGLELGGEGRRSKRALPASEEPIVSGEAKRYLWSVTLLIAVATATLLALDYVFKATAARSLEAGRLGSFFAAYYALLNLLAFLFQLLLATQLLRRLGLLAALVVLPVLLLLGGSLVLASGGGLLAVLVLKGADGGLRHSLHRTATELLWMPLPPRVRARAKPLVDTIGVRLAQAFAAMGVFALAWWSLDDARTLALVISGLAVLWIGLAVSLRGPYIALFRRALKDDRELEGPLRLNLASLEILVEALSNMNPRRATAAIQLLASNRKTRLIPALVLFHPSSDVLLSALEHVPSPDREDWIEPTERLINHELPAVRMAAMNALLKHGIQGPIEQRLNAPDPAVRGHATFLLADRYPGPPENHPSVESILQATGETGTQSKRALLQAISAGGDRRWTAVLISLLHDAKPEVAQDAVKAAARVRDERLVEPLVYALGARGQRDDARDALVAQGPAALELIRKLVFDANTEQRLRRHLPRTISRFGNQAAADILLSLIDTEFEGVVRYKALRGLGRLATETSVDLDRELLEGELRDNLVEHLKALAAREVVASAVAATNQRPEVSAELLLDLLWDKARQALERAFRMMQLLYLEENIRSVSEALLSEERSERAQAFEYLMTLTVDLEATTRELLRIATDDFESGVRVSLARAELADLPESYPEALARLTGDDDEELNAIAHYHVRRARPGLSEEVVRLRSALESGARDTASARLEATEESVVD